MKRADAQRVADDLTDEKIKGDITGLLTELRDKPDDPDVIENYRRRIAGHDQALAVATDFIGKNFKD
jgi:hypothetical protein